MYSNFGVHKPNCTIQPYKSNNNLIIRKWINILLSRATVKWEQRLKHKAVKLSIGYKSTSTDLRPKHDLSNKTSSNEKFQIIHSFSNWHSEI